MSNLNPPLHPILNQRHNQNPLANDQERLNLKLEIVYSMKLAQAMYKLFCRAYRFSIFLLLLLGALAFSNVLVGWVLGGLIMVICFWLMAVLPNQKTVLYRIKYQQYYDLFTDFDGLAIPEIKRRKKIIAQNDSEVIKSLEKVAWTSSLLILDLSRADEQPFTWLERLAAQFAGEYSADLER